jgi:hypothetical protein
MSQAPVKIAINLDNYHARHVGRTADGRQFFLTRPFIPAQNGAGAEFIALYIFDQDGQFLGAEIDYFGPRSQVNEAAYSRCFEARLQSLGAVTFERIEIAPFQVVKDSVVFGLIVSPPEDEGDEFVAEFLPGNVMAFYEPWDSGEYET